MNLEETETLKNKVYQALGTASMCWTETPKGVFNSTEAQRVGDELWKAIEDDKAKRFDMKRFREVNTTRAAAKDGFNCYENVPLCFWTTALPGEVGELCNMVKKIERVRYGGIDVGSSYTAASLTKEMLMEEVGGIYIYLDLVASLLKIDMEEAVRYAFNKKSEEHNLPYKYE